jgi:hypothetical protein
MALIKTRARGLKLDDTFAFTGTVSGAGGGKIGQVVQSETDYYHNLGATTSNVTLKFSSSTNWNPTITPTATSSKILIIANFMLFADHGGHGNWFNHPYNRSFLRSPNTTSAVTYRFAMHGMASNVNTALNVGGSQASGTMNKSSFIMIEVLA